MKLLAYFLRILTNVLAATLVAHREAAKLLVCHDICRTMYTGINYSSVKDVAILHTDTSLENILNRNLTVLTGYVGKGMSEIKGLCLACIRDREHDKSSICF